MWMNILKAALSIADAIASYMERKQLLDAGAAIAIKDNLHDTLEKVRKADAARRAVQHDADSVHNDKNNRD